MPIVQPQTVEIAQVLVFKDEALSKLVAPAVETSFEEVRQFFETPGDRFDVPVGGGGFAARVELKFAFKDISSDTPALASVWKQAQVGKEIYDHQVVGELVKMMAELTGTTVIVTDVEIAPPADWRYIIWDAFPEGVVVSLAPLDPLYWGERTSADERVGTIKSRVRAANLSIVGQLVGLTRCDNDECFLFADVDS